MINILFGTYVYYFLILFGLGYLFKRYIPNATWVSKTVYCLIAPLITIGLGVGLTLVFVDAGIIIIEEVIDVFVTAIAVSWILYVMVYFTIRGKKKE